MTRLARVLAVLASLCGVWLTRARRVSRFDVLLKTHPIPPRR